MACFSLQTGTANLTGAGSTTRRRCLPYRKGRPRYRFCEISSLTILNSPVTFNEKTGRSISSGPAPTKASQRSHSTLMFRILSFLHLCFGENSFAKSWILRIYSETPRSFLVCVTRHTMHNPCQFRLNIGALSIRPYRWQIGCWPLDLQRFQSPEASG